MHQPPYIESWAPHQPRAYPFDLTIAAINVQAELEGMPKLLVFGGNGYVGTRVCEEALNTGLQIVSINRSGKPRGTDAWINEVDWVQVKPCEKFRALAKADACHK